MTLKGGMDFSGDEVIIGAGYAGWGGTEGTYCENRGKGKVHDQEAKTNPSSKRKVLFTQRILCPKHYKNKKKYGDVRQ